MPTNFDDVKLLNSFRRETRFNFLFNRKLPMYCRMLVDSFTMQMYKNIRFNGVIYRKKLKLNSNYGYIVALFGIFLIIFKSCFEHCFLLGS